MQDIFNRISVIPKHIMHSLVLTFPNQMERETVTTTGGVGSDAVAITTR